MSNSDPQFEQARQRKDAAISLLADYYYSDGIYEKVEAIDLRLAQYFKDILIILRFININICSYNKKSCYLCNIQR